MGNDEEYMYYDEAGREVHVFKDEFGNDIHVIQYRAIDNIFTGHQLPVDHIPVISRPQTFPFHRGAPDRVVIVLLLNTPAAFSEAVLF